MSAFLLGKPHIDALVRAALDVHDPLRWYDCDPATLEAYTTREEYLKYVAPHHHKATHEEVDRIGQMLWLTNLASVAYRYPQTKSNERPGPVGLTDTAILAYRFPRNTRSHDPVTMLSALSCYEYQSSERPDWRQSEAYYFCQALRLRLIRALPGYDAAPWEITA